MFSNALIGLILGIGAGGWVYMKSMRHTGGNAGNSAMAALAVGVFAFFVMFTLLSSLF